MDIVNASFFDHFMNPRNSGLVEGANGIGKWGDPGCGDFIVVSIRIEKDVIEDIKFTSNGCSASIASTSLMTELAKGKSVEEALGITGEMIDEAIGGLPDDRKHCSILGEQALKAAINDYLSGGS